MRYLILLLITLCIVACSPKGNIPSSADGPVLDLPTILSQLSTQDADWDWLVARSRVQVESPQYDGQITVQLRMRKDSLIWIHMSKLSVEAARIQITPDSISMINRLEKLYVREDIAELSNRLGVDMNFHTLQAWILGDILHTYDREADMTMDSTIYHLSQRDRDIDHDLYLLRSTLQMSAQKISDPRSGEVSMSYEAYELQEGAPRSIATERTVEMMDRKGQTYVGELKGLRVKWNEPATTRFRIPPHYERQRL